MLFGLFVVLLQNFVIFATAVGKKEEVTAYEYFVEKDCTRRPKLLLGRLIRVVDLIRFLSTVVEEKKK